MQLLKKTILAGMCLALLSVVSFAQTQDIESADAVTQADIISYWATNNEEALEKAFADYPMSWSSYVLSLGHESKEATRLSDLFHAFTADFTSQYGMKPQQASIALLKEYYAKRKYNFGGELLLPTMAVWHNRPMLSIVPQPDQLDAYWGKPDQAGDTYDFMAQIDREDTLYFMGSHMGAFFGHPTQRKTLENFWKKWMKRSDDSAAKQDIEALKRIMLAEILSHDPEYAVQELASKKVDLWPALFVGPVTPEEQANVRNIFMTYCLKKDADTGTVSVTESCVKFAEYADRYEYSNDLVQQIRDNLARNKSVNGYTDEIYTTSNVYWVADPDLLWPYDPWYGWYYQSGVRIYIHVHRPFISPWYWRYWYWSRPPVIVRPGHHRPPTVHHGHRPPVVRPGHGGGHHPGGRPGTHRPGDNGRRPSHPGGHGHNPGGNGGHGHNPGHNPGGNGGHGHNPGHNPGGNGGNGHNPGGNGDNPGHNPGGNGGHGHNPGHNPGGNGGHGHNPGHNPGGNGGNGHNPGGNGDNPGHNPGGNGGNPGGNGTNPGHRPGSITMDRTRPSVTKVDAQPATRSSTIREEGRTSINPGNIGNAGHRPSSRYNGASSRSSTAVPNRPSSNNNFGGSNRPSTTTQSRSSSGSHSGGSRSSSGHPSMTPNRPSFGGVSGGSSRSSSSRSFGGHSRPSGGSHGGSSSGSRGSSHGGGHRR